MTRFITFLIFTILFSGIAVAQTDGSKERTPIYIIKGNSQRPRIPSTNHLDIIFLSDGFIEIEAPDYIQTIQVEISDNIHGAVLSVIVARSDAFVDVSDLHGEYEITCRTDGNQVFGGIIEIP